MEQKEKRLKIEKIIGVLSGKLPVDELLTPRFKIRVGFGPSPQFFINDKSVNEQEFNNRSVTASKSDPIKFKVTSINYEGSDDDN